MEIDLLYVSDRPNRTMAREHLDRALEQAGLSSTIVREREVGSGEDAVQLGMRGSPTIIIDGRDPFGDADQPVSSSCRLYRTDTGMTGAPSIEQLVALFPR